MAVLIVKSGLNAGKRYPLRQDATTLGRHPDCDIALDSVSISRHHARILRIGGVHYVEDLQSHNGTQVNGSTIRDRVQLNDGDRLAVCDIVFCFQATEHADQYVSVVDDLASSTDVAASRRICILQETPGGLERACLQVRRSLKTHRIVFYPITETSVLYDALLHDDPGALQILGEGYYRMIVLDVARGLRQEGEFDLANFREYAFRRLEEAFDLQPANSCHGQDLIQMLMDKEDSLVCLVNAQEAPSDDRKRLRRLTQERHHVLIAYRQPGKP